jgi:hypothetical protein
MVQAENGSNRSSRESKAYVRMALIQGALLAPSARALGEQSTLPLSIPAGLAPREHALPDLEGEKRPGSEIRA